MLGTPLARLREPQETIGKSKEALGAAQWERMQTGRLSEHFWAKSDYVRRGAAWRAAAATFCVSGKPMINETCLKGPMIYGEGFPCSSVCMQYQARQPPWLHVIISRCRTSTGQGPFFPIIRLSGDFSQLNGLRTSYF